MDVGLNALYSKVFILGTCTCISVNCESSFIVLPLSSLSTCRFGNLIPSFQSLQLGAALGLVRLALIVGLINQPLTGTNIPEDVVNRQVVHA